MKTHKTLMSVIVAVVLVGVCASPVWAHQKYRPNPSGSPKRIPIRHTHEIAEAEQTLEAEQSLAPTTVKSEEQEFDPVKVVFDAIEGTLKALDYAVSALLGTQPEETKIAEGPEEEPREYKYIRKYTGGAPRWVRKRIDK